MKTISFKDFEQHFDDFIDDVIDNGRHYRIELENGKALALIPYKEYEVLLNTYEEWLKELETKD
jgi:PHD/YefM family antitoxin component YafN of YafNO toxin-antitoxin module